MSAPPSTPDDALPHPVRDLPAAPALDAHESTGSAAPGVEGAELPSPRQNVTRLEYAGKTIYLIGTAHVSRRSVEEVRSTIEALRPNTVCVELDAERHRMLTDREAWRKVDIFQIIRQKKVLLLLSSLALGAFQRRMGEKLGVQPGAELLEAVQAAQDVGAELVLADRNIQATLKRTWANLSVWERSQVVSGLLVAPFSVEEIDEGKIEALKEQDSLGEMMKEVAEQFPKVKVPLIDERDAYLMSTIAEAPGPVIVAVVGAAHVRGMVERLGQQVDRGELERIPPPSLWGRVFAWALPLLVVGSFALGAQDPSGEGFSEMLLAWVLPTAGLASLFTILALGHPLTVLTAFFVAPLTTLHPALGAGMFTGLVEAYLRKPTVEDCEGIQKAFSSVRGVYTNRATRVLLVAFLSSIGAALGAYIGATWVLSLV